MKKHLLIVLLSVTAISVTAQPYPYQNPELSSEVRAADLCSRLTLEEKASLMKSSSPAIPRLGIPQFDWWNEVLHGVARNGFATVFPSTIGMAASFDDDLLFRVFDAASDEARAKANTARRSGTVKRYQSLSFWTPNINIFRDPRWGRGQETYGEDPYLTARMGLAVVRGLQGDGSHRYSKLLACAKHFAVHSGPEWNRHVFNIESLPERDLWETYLPAFKSLVQEGNVAEVMCAYQRIDGDPCCGNTRYLQQILRNDWGFKGIVTSDCGAIDDFWRPGYHGVSANAHEASAKAVRAGTDVECGSNYLKLPEAVAKGEITEAEIDISLKRLLKARFELGDFDPETLVDWQQMSEDVVASAAHKQLALDMARKSIVLLKNNGVLPLKSPNRQIVIMGPNANDSVMMWGNYSGYPTKTVTALEGIRQITPAKYVLGCGLTRNEQIESQFGAIRDPQGRQGLQITYWNNTEQEGEPVTVVNAQQAQKLSNGGNTVFAPGVNLENFSARMEGTLTPQKDETLIFTISGDDRLRLLVNGDTLVNYWTARQRIQVGRHEMQVKAGQAYRIKIEYVQESGFASLAFDVQRKIAPTAEELLAEVGEAETVVFVGGISPSLEGEEMRVSEPGFRGGDRESIELPQAQRDVLAMLHKAGKIVVFVNCSGSAIALTPELESCDAILQWWYGGEQGGTALAEVLFGQTNPSGKLPVTFYRSTADLPDFLEYSMKNRTYRYFTGEPLFPFGYGLSYTTFQIGKPTYKNNKVQVRVTNTGTKEGTETVQVYIRNTADSEGPLKSLRAYSQVALKPGEAKSVSIDLPRSSFEGWDAQTNTMRVIPGKYEIMVGNSSASKDQQMLTVNIR